MEPFFLQRSDIFCCAIIPQVPTPGCREVEVSHDPKVRVHETKKAT